MGPKAPPNLWMQTILSTFWGGRISPFSMMRFLGQKQVVNMMGHGMKQRFKFVKDDKEVEALRDYLY
jgi:hypothetical protein